MSESLDELVEQAEHPEDIQRCDLRTLLAYTDFDELPHRHPERLRDAFEDCDSISRMATRLGTDDGTVRRWLHIWGIKTRAERREEMTLAERVRYTGGADD